MATQNKSKVPTGTMLEGKFRVTREIGRGGMAAVYEAENIDIGKRVAVKILAAELITSRRSSASASCAKRAPRAAIRSPYICDVYDSGVYEERPFLVMELLEGESLYDLLTRVRRLDSETTLDDHRRTRRAGSRKAHESNIVHRDLKPETSSSPRRRRAACWRKLLDFGLAKFYEPDRRRREDRAAHPRRRALRHARVHEPRAGQGPGRSRSPRRSVGARLHRLRVSDRTDRVERRPRRGDDPRADRRRADPAPFALRPDLPKTFDHWFSKALDRDPNKRFQTAKEFADTLADALRPVPEPSAQVACTATLKAWWSTS